MNPTLSSGRPSFSTVQAGLVAAALGLALIFGVGENGGLVMLSAASLAIGGFLTWRAGEAPILLLLFAYHWFQASVSTLYATFLGIPVEFFSPIPGNHRDAIVLTQVALLFWAIGLRVGAGSVNNSLRTQILAISNRYPLALWFKVYLVATVIGLLAQFVGAVFPSLSQVTLGVAQLRWAFYFLLASAAFIRGDASNPSFIIAFVTELFFGIGGYYSDFKTVLFVTMLAAVVSGLRLSLVGISAFGALAAATIMFGIVWTSIKMEYRSDISSGRYVTFDERTGRLWELASNLSRNDLDRGADQMLRRMSYTEFFGAVVSYVPNDVPHENGAITADAILRPFMPRVLFSEKTAIHDSERTIQYTGLRVSGVAENTSISLGWIAEFYIDFGSYFMMLAVFLYGAFLGRLKRAFESWQYSRGALGGAISLSVLLGALLMESSFTKVFGGLIATSLAAWLILRFVGPHWLAWLRSPA